MSNVSKKTNFKEKLTNLILDIKDNCKIIIESNTLNEEELLKMEIFIQDIDNIIIWYKNVKSKTT